jgi:hypothetical protein
MQLYPSCRHMWWAAEHNNSSSDNALLDLSSWLAVVVIWRTRLGTTA